MAGEAGSNVEFRVLGAVEARRDGQAVPLGGTRQRALLSLLLLNAGRPVSVDFLADELWAGEPPDGAETTLRSYVSRLRAALGDGGPITHSAAGYALTVDHEAIDARRFERLLHEAETMQRRGWRRSRDRLLAALGLWAGRPFADLARDGAIQVEADRLEDLRLRALELRVEADIQLGRVEPLVDELEALVREHPFRERFWQQLMLALYHAGRQADALAAYHRARRELDAQLGIAPGPELQALEASILRQDVPAPSGAIEGNLGLPAPLSSFVGRKLELEDVTSRLGGARLVTLTGVGGVGKTRLALEAARRVAAKFADGVAFVDLSPIADASLVAAQVAAALGVREQGDADLLGLIAGQVRDTELLLVVDNCEHVREAAAGLAQRLLTESPDLTILATSREPLGVAGEADVPVQPMTVTDAGGDAADAVALFLARATAARPGLPSTDQTLAVATRICGDLDGLPLAIELAAARAKSLSLDDIAARLDDRFRFLVSWRRLTAARHRTLREAMDWSYELLEPREQAVLRRLSVFAGGFSLDGVGAISDASDEEALQLLERLVEASLVIIDEGPGVSRYRLLETVRQYAGGRVAEEGEDEGLRAAHAAWCLGLAEAAAPELSGDAQGRWFARLEAEHNNMRAALAHLDAIGDVREVLRMSIALTRFWYVRGHLTEGRHWLERALATDMDPDPVLRRRALTAVASLALLQGEYAVATRFAEQGLTVARETGEKRFEANALSNLGAIVLAAGDTSRAATLLHEAVAVARVAGDERILALAVNNLGDLELTRGDYPRAQPLFEESLGLLRARGDTANMARSLFNLGACELQLGRAEAAETHFREGLVLADDAGDREDLAWLLEGFAALAAARGDGERAGTLLGAASALLEAMGADYKPFERRQRDQTAEMASSLLGNDAFEHASARGRAMDLREAIALATAAPT